MNRLQSFISAIVLAADSCRAPQAATHSTAGNVTLTDWESLWRDEFANYDLGYQTLLPEGLVALGSDPPNPIQGFLGGLPHARTTRTVTVNDERFILGGAEYNSQEFKSLKDLADHTIELMAKEKSGFKITFRETVKLDGVTATE